MISVFHARNLASLFDMTSSLLYPSLSFLSQHQQSKSKSSRLSCPITERSNQATTMAPDCHDNRVVDNANTNVKRKSNNNDAERVAEQEPPSSSVSSLSVVTGNRPVATMGVGIGVDFVQTAKSNSNSKSPRSPDSTRTTTTTTTTRAATTAKTTNSNETTTGQRLDFIGTTNAVKKLFSMSLDVQQQQQQQHTKRNAKKPTLLAVHNFDGTLIIDDAEDESNYEFFQSNNNNNKSNDGGGEGDYYDSMNPDHWYRDEKNSDASQSTTTLLPPSSQSLALALSPPILADNRIEQQRQRQPQRDQLSKDAISMLSNIVAQSTALTSTSASDHHHQSSSQQQQPSSSALLAPPKAPREYVQWKFQDLNMLLGHDGLVVRPTTTNTASSSSAANDNNSEASAEGGGIAVRVEDVRFLRSVWEAFQRQQMQQQQQIQQQQQQQSFLGSASTNARSYAQALLQERESEKESENESKELTNTTSAVVAAVAAINESKSTTTINDPQKDVAGAVANPNGIEKKQRKRGFSEVPLQTCIVPFPRPLGGKLYSPLDSSSPSPLSTGASSSSRSVHTIESSSSPALSIVLDAYLDNLMANVPQLALCLEEKGLIQSVKMLPTEEIPSMMLHPSTLDTSHPLDVLPSRGGGSGGGFGGNPTDGGNNNNTAPAQQRVHRHHRRNRSGSVSGSKLEETMFSPQIMEMNASALLRFLKTNCTRNHATYLLRHEGLDETAAAAAAACGDGTSPPPQNIQLYDISSISTQKQKKWIWWLATMSYRFALRLRHLETSSEASSFPPRPSGTILSESQKRAIRDRQRSLFQQTLDLLQDLMDIDGNAHESMVASVREHMADTYLSSVAASGGGVDLGETTFSAENSEFKSKSKSPRKQSISEFSPSPSPPVVTATISATASGVSPPSSSSSSFVPTKNSPHQLPNSENAPAMPLSDVSTSNPERRHRQPYADVSVDALNKAQDHLVRGIKTLSTLFERNIEERRLYQETQKLEEEAAWKRSRRRPRKQRGSVENEAGSAKISSKDRQEEKDDDGRIPKLSPAMILQLFGMNFKLVNISLRLAEHHLGNYYSSSAMQALRTAARRLNDAARLLDYCSSNTGTRVRSKEDENEKRNESSLQLQYIWLLEHCGHFARSFASDELWRDRGHASGEDVISVLSDVENVFAESRKPIGGNYNDDGEGEMEMESQFWKMVRMDVLLKKSKGRISLQSLSGIVAPFQMNASQTEKAIEAAKQVLAKEKVLRRERRRVLVASCVSYSRAITAFQFTVKTSDSTDQAPEKLVLLNLLCQRLGDACNETGKVLLAALRTLLVNNQGSKKKNDASQLAAEALLDSAEFWFTQGLEAFEACRDTRNLALLRCNLCQSFKLRANSGFSKRDDSSSSSSSSKHAENCLQMAADQLVKAHVDLSQRDVDPQTWDMVSEELAATFLVLGVRRRQSLLGSGNAPVIFQVMRLSPGEERSIVDPMERALKIYEQSDNEHQGAAVHYQLALTFSKLWTCQLNESNTRKKLSKAFGHYSSAFDYFSTHSRGNEPTFCLLCLDLASLYAAIPGEEGLMKSLGCCLDCCDTFSVEAMQLSSSNTGRSFSTAKSKADWYDKMETIAQSVDDRVFKLLRSLVKVDPVRYKDMYREGLTAKMVRNVPDENEEFDRNPKSSAILALHEVLLAIKKMYGVIVSKS
jgi:hypothetical protein